MSNSVPAIAYGFVGVTALVLTYATLADNGGKAESSTESTTSMLPAIGEPTEPEPEPEPEQTPAQEPTEEEATPVPEGSYGGKRKKRKGGKKSKMNKVKTSDKKRRHTRHHKV